MKIENWCGYDIRFVEINGEWWAILKDICDALRLRTDKIASRLDPSMLERVKVEVSDHPSKVDRSDAVSNGLRYEHQPIKAINKAMIGKDISRHPGENKTRWMLAVNELGIYEALIQIEKNVSKWSKIIYIYYPMPRYVISQNSNLGEALLTMTMKRMLF